MGPVPFDLATVEATIVVDDVCDDGEEEDVEVFCGMDDFGFPFGGFAGFDLLRFPYLRAMARHTTREGFCGLYLVA